MNFDVLELLEAEYPACYLDLQILYGQKAEDPAYNLPLFKTGHYFCG